MQCIMAGTNCYWHAEGLLIIFHQLCLRSLSLLTQCMLGAGSTQNTLAESLCSTVKTKAAGCYPANSLLTRV
jgi:hypothetical protein